MKRTAFLVATIGTIALITGCGGGDDDPNAGLPPTLVASPSASAYAGTYRSASIALPDGRIGTTAFTVGGDDRATGTLTVTDGATTRQATSFNFAVGTYAISGTIDPTTGAFSMTGNIGGQTFSYIGTLPTPGNGNVGGSYTLTAGGQTYTGSFAGSGGTVSPTPAPSSTPIVNPSPVAPPNGTPLNITFSAIDGVQNVDASDFTIANNTLLQAYPYGAGTVFQSLTIIANSTVAGSTDPNRSRRFAVQFFDLEPTVGATYTTGGAQNVGVQFYQFEDNNGLSPSGRLYNGSGGTVTVVARTANSITVRVSNMTMTPGNYIKGLPTAGAFVANGEITAPIQ